VNDRRPRRRPGVRDVAERAGVAISSVSRVLTAHPDVSDEMRERVMAAVEVVGYKPDLLAQGLRRQRTMSVGFVASHIGNPVLAETVTGAERVLRGSGYSLLVTDSEGDPQLDADNVDVLEQRRVDGMLLSLSDESHEPLARTLALLETPFVLVDRNPPPGLSRAASVTFDHRAGMREAAEHLWELGHRHVALIGGGPRRPAAERRAGVEDVFHQRGGTVDVAEGPFTVEHGAEAAAALLAAPAPPTALVAGGNLLMIGALRALRERGLRLGADISFVGCDDVAVAELHDPPVAVVTREPKRIGELGAELLLAMLEEREGPPTHELPTSFLPRPSCAPPA
jgi:LacI family transcriptional regulator, galactose operon repressor